MTIPCQCFLLVWLIVALTQSDFFKKSSITFSITIIFSTKWNKNLRFTKNTKIIASIDAPLIHGQSFSMIHHNLDTMYGTEKLWYPKVNGDLQDFFTSAVCLLIGWNVEIFFKIFNFEGLQNWRIWGKNFSKITFGSNFTLKKWFLGGLVPKRSI